MVEQTRFQITAEDKTGPGIASVQSSIDRLSGSFGSLLNPVALAGTAFSTASLAAVAMVKSSIDLGDEMSKLSQRVGVSVKDLSSWSFAADLSGTNIEAVAKGIKGLSTYLLEYGTAAEKAGITAKDANGALIQFADLFKTMPDGLTKTALAVKVFGKAGIDMIPLLNMGSKGLSEAQEKARVYGERMALLAPMAAQFNDQLTEIGLQSRAAGLAIANPLLPGLVGVATWLNDLATGGERAATALEFLSENSPLFKGVVEFNKLATKALALVGAFDGKGTRSVSGSISGLQLDAAAELALGDKNERVIAAIRRAEALSGSVGGAGKNGKSAKASGPIDVFGSGSFITRDKETAKSIQDSFEFENWAYAQLHMDREAAAKDIDRLRQKYTELGDPLQKYRDQLGEIEQLKLIGRESGGLSVSMAIAAARKVNEAMDTEIAKMGEVAAASDEQFGQMTEFAKEAARSMQSSMSDFFFDSMQGKFDSLGSRFKVLVDHMVADAIAADLSNRLLGNFGKTGEVGGWLGSLLGSLGGDGGASAAIASATASNGGFFPYYEKGTPYVPRTGLAMIHQGERIIPAAQNKPGGFGGNITVIVQGSNNAPDVRRAAGQGAREALNAFAGAQRYG